MAIINDLTDKTARLAIPYGLHPVKGHLTKHQVDMVGNEKQVTIQRALGKGPWDSRVALYYAGELIDPANSNFHQGLANDAPDAYFPSDIAHPNAAYESTRLPLGMGDEDRPDRLIGIYKTLQVVDYNAAGVQTGFAYSPSPARHALDLMLRSKRSIARVNYTAWTAWRDYCAALINWDDGALTPHFVQLAASAGGSLAPGTYWVRIATIKGADLSSASKDRASDGVTTASVVISGGNLQFTVTWATQAERGATGYRVYIGTAEGAEDRYFTVGSGATNTLLVTTLTGATLGAPPAIATGALLRQIPRFESHLFFIPPFDLSIALDRIAQVTCMDWQYSNGKLVFLTPEVRSPVFTLNLAEANSFKTYQTDRRQKPNQIIVNYRDLDSPYLEPADPPVIIPHPGTSPSDPRMVLQSKEGIRPFEINLGGGYRSQAERAGNYWYRRLVESDQMIEMFGSPKTYIVLPGDPVNVTHNVPNWTDVPFYIEEKEETEDVKAGYQLKGRIYPPGGWYSDTLHNPLPRPLPEANPSAFAAPPLITSLTLTENNVLLPEGVTLITSIRGAVQFAAFVGHQRGRVWWRNAAEEKTFTVDAATDVFTAAAHGLANGTPVSVRNFGGGLPAPLAALTTYYVVNSTTDTFKLAATSGGAAINITSAGTGTQYIGAFKVTNEILVPEPSTLQAAFEIVGVAQGYHSFKVVTESELGVSQAFAVHVETPITIAAPVNSFLQLLDLPLWRDSEATSPPGIYIGAGQAAAGSYFGTVIQRDDGNDHSQVARVTKQATLGIASTALANGTVYGYDEVSTVRVQLKHGKTLTSVSDFQLGNGANMAALGIGANKEIIQFKTATLVGGTTDTYDLSFLKRGLFGTEFATSLHAINDEFCLLRDNKLRDDTIAFLPIPVQQLNQAKNYRSYTINQPEADGTVQAFTWTGNSHRPYAVAGFDSVKDSDLDAIIDFEGRTRVAGNLRDFRSPIVAEERQEFRMRLTNSSYVPLEPAREMTIVPGTALSALLHRDSDVSGSAPTKTGEWSVIGEHVERRARSLNELARVGDFVEGTLSNRTRHISGVYVVIVLVSVESLWRNGGAILSPAYAIGLDNTGSGASDIKLGIREDIPNGAMGGSGFVGTVYPSTAVANSSRVRIAASERGIEFYLNAASTPLYVSPIPPVFPLRMLVITSDSFVTEMIVRGKSKATYLASQRTRDYGSSGATAFAELWQQSAIVGKGRVLRVSF